MTALDTALHPITEELGLQLDFLTEVYNRLQVEAVIVDGQPNEKPRRLPLVADGEKYGKLYPDKGIDGLSFWIKTGPARTREYDAAFSGNQFYVEQPIALIVWGKPCDTDLQHDVFAVLAQFPQFMVSSFTDQLQSSVFAGLDYDFIGHQYLMHPYKGIRIEGVITYQQSLC